MFISLYKTCIYTQTHTLNFSEVLNLMSVFSPSIVAFDRNKIAHSWVWHTILNCLNCQVHGTVQLSPMYNWRCTGDRNQDHPQEKEMQKSKMAVWGGLTNSCKDGKEKQRSKGQISSFECRVPNNSKERSESLPQRSVQRDRGKQ